jgi:hypothetical protein
MPFADLRDRLKGWRENAVGTATDTCTSCCSVKGVVLNHKKLFRLVPEERLTVRRRGGRKRGVQQLQSIRS